MPKVILKGPPQCLWDIDGHMRPGGTEIDLTELEIKKHKSVVIEIIKEKKEKEEVKEIPKPPKILKYTKESLQEIYEKKGLNTLRKIAKKFKVKFRSIEEGIKEILEAQK